MAITVREDITSEIPKVSESNGHLAATRHFLVYGLTETEHPSHTRLYTVLFLPEIPKYLDFHPSIPTLFVKNRDAEIAAPDSPYSVKVTIEYETLGTAVLEPVLNGPAVLRVGGTVQSKVTTQFSDGTLLPKVYYLPPGILNPDGTQKILVDQATIEIPDASVVFSLTRVIDYSPGGEATTYVGSVNSVDFLGFAPRRWMCTNISGETNDLGATWLATYDFQLAGNWETELWDVEYSFKGDDGKVPSDIQTNDANHPGIVKIRWARERDFNLLNF